MNYHTQDVPRKRGHFYNWWRGYTCAKLVSWLIPCANLPTGWPYQPQWMGFDQLRSSLKKFFFSIVVIFGKKGKQLRWDSNSGRLIDSRPPWPLRQCCSPLATFSTILNFRSMGAPGPRNSNTYFHLFNWTFSSISVPSLSSGIKF